MAEWIRPDEPATAGEEPAFGVEPPGTDELPDLPGIDTGEGLATTQGNVSLLRKLLIRFREQQRDFEQQFRAAQADKDADAATRVAHTLKGVAGNVGAFGVEAAAHSLEMACKVGAEGIDESLATVIAELQRVIDGLDAPEAPVRKESATAPTAIDKMAVEPFLRELHALVASDNVNASDVVEKLEPLLNNTDCDGHLNNLVSAVEDYDFEVALGSLTRLAGHLEINL